MDRDNTRTDELLICNYSIKVARETFARWRDAHLSVTVLVEKLESFVDLLSEVRLYLPQLHHRDELIERDASTAISVHLNIAQNNASKRHIRQ